MVTFRLQIGRETRGGNDVGEVVQFDLGERHLCLRVNAKSSTLWFQYLFWVKGFETRGRKPPLIVIGIGRPAASAAGLFSFDGARGWLPKSHDGQHRRATAGPRSSSPARRHRAVFRFLAPALPRRASIGVADDEAGARFQAGGRPVTCTRDRSGPLRQGFRRSQRP